MPQITQIKEIKNLELKNKNLNLCYLLRKDQKLKICLDLQNLSEK
jgi:hypothetical protein